MNTHYTIQTELQQSDNTLVSLEKFIKLHKNAVFLETCEHFGYSSDLNESIKTRQSEQSDDRIVFGSLSSRVVKDQVYQSHWGTST